tara:strand:- start:483 stop:689 length:207 start_codon:yes stop_codon:yes gene_type:complete
MQRELIKNINSINSSINELCSSINRNKEEITLIAVSKKKNFKLIEIALENGYIILEKIMLKSLKKSHH